MDIILIYSITVGIIVLILVAINVVLFWYSRKTNQMVDTLLEKGKIKDFKDIFLNQKEKNNNLEEEIKEAFSKIKDLENTLSKTIQKTGVVRFSTIAGVGGNQSFAIALLDEKNNGFVISSLFVQDGNRVYAKAIKDGNSEHTLSNEEKEAINKAIKSQK